MRSENLTVICKKGSSVERAAKELMPGGAHHENVKLARKLTGGDHAKLCKEITDPKSPLYKAAPFYPTLLYASTGAKTAKEKYSSLAEFFDADTEKSLKDFLNSDRVKDWVSKLTAGNGNRGVNSP